MVQNCCNYFYECKHSPSDERMVKDRRTLIINDNLNLNVQMLNQFTRRKIKIYQFISTQWSFEISLSSNDSFRISQSINILSLFQTYHRPTSRSSISHLHEKSRCMGNKIVCNYFYVSNTWWFAIEVVGCRDNHDPQDFPFILIGF